LHCLPVNNEIKNFAPHALPFVQMNRRVSLCDVGLFFMEPKVENLFVEKFLDEKGLKIISNFNSYGKIDIKCKNNHIFSKWAKNIYKSYRCPICYYESKKISIDLINERLLKKGIKIIGEYKKSIVKTIFECSNGHQWESTPHGVMSKAGCPICAGNSKYAAMQKFIKTAKNKNYTILGKYINSHTPVEMICPNGHKTKMRPTTFYTANCIFCIGKGRGQAKEKFIKELAKENYTIVGEYVNSYKRCMVQCENGHTFLINMSKLAFGRRCVKCNGRGFDVSKTVTFYVYKMIKNKSEYVGFGITNDFKMRHATHCSMFRKHNIKWEIISTVDFLDGSKALEIETKIRKNPNIIDLGIIGFRKECLPYFEKDMVLSYISTPL
jgi:hypothetical protein